MKTPVAERLKAAVLKRSSLEQGVSAAIAKLIPADNVDQNAAASALQTFLFNFDRYFNEKNRREVGPSVSDHVVGQFEHILVSADDLARLIDELLPSQKRMLDKFLDNATALSLARSISIAAGRANLEIFSDDEPSETEEARPGKKRNQKAIAVAGAALEAYQLATGRDPSITRHIATGARTGKFVTFMKDVFASCEVEGAADYYADQAVSQLKASRSSRNS